MQSPPNGRVKHQLAGNQEHQQWLSLAESGTHSRGLRFQSDVCFRPVAELWAKGESISCSGRRLGIIARREM